MITSFVLAFSCVVDLNNKNIEIRLNYKKNSFS